MENSGVRVEEGTVRETYSGAAWRKAMAKYVIKFEVHGQCCSAWFNPQNGEFYTDCPAPQSEGLYGAAAELERIIGEPKPHLDSLGLRKFLYEHLRAMIDVETELQGSPASESTYEFLNLETVDLEKLSLEEQRLFELIKQEAEKANETRVNSK
jgi:hypothetical protein